VLELFPDTAEIADGELSIGGVRATALAHDFGTPLVVYCEKTIRARAQAYRAAAPDALVVYGTKAFPNVAVLRLVADEGLGADVSTLGELRFALAAGVPAERLVVHGNNKSDEELAAAADAGAAYLVVDSLEELERTSSFDLRSLLVRVTPGIEAETHVDVRTAHTGSKFGLAPEDALRAIEDERVVGLHVHVGSQLLSPHAAVAAVTWLNEFAAHARWMPRVLDLGGGLGVPTTPGQRAPSIPEFVAALLAELTVDARVILEPGRSLVAAAGVTLYRVGVVKRVPGRAWVAVDGGVSDNPRPQLYDAPYTAMLASRAHAVDGETYAVAGKHCESGDVLVAAVELPDPRRGDILAVPVTGAYTLGMASNYNGVPRPAAVLVRDGDARLIRRRETVDDLLRTEVP
jgi:diaminopimelate decarboxylase